MRKRTAFLFAFVALLVLGCVPTPEAEVVLKKDTQRMIETAGNAEQESLREMAEVPENMHIFQEVASTRTDVRITIDAEVVMPDTTAIPVVHVQHGQIQEDILCNAKRLIGNDSGALDGFPRAYYLAEAQKWADRRDAGELDKYDSVEELNAAIADLLSKASEAPEIPVFKEKDPLDEMRENEFVSYVMADLTYYRKKYGNKSVRKSVSIPEWMDIEAENAGISCSQVLQDAIREKLMQEA